jgi:hypothetical protein
MNCIAMFSKFRSVAARAFPIFAALLPALLAIALFVIPASVTAQSFSGVLTWHNDNGRTGQNLAETVLTPVNVNSAQFGKAFSFPVEGQVYAQPLYAPNVTIAGKGKHNVIYIATEHDSVYAFDADGLSQSPLWHVTFIDPPTITTMPCTSDMQPECDVTILDPEHGITATPVIDAAAGTIFVVAKTVESGVYMEKLHALDITTGAERTGSPIKIEATAPGYPTVKFSGLTGVSRAALLLLNHTVYIGYASNDDDRGWLIGYDAATLKQTRVFCVTPTGQLGGIWGGGAGPGVDSAGNIYFMTGNGSFDVNTGGASYGMSMVKLAVNGSGFTVSDYFTPYNEMELTRKDMDFASGGLVVLPDQPGAYPHEVTGGFKTGQVFMVNRDNMGKFNSTTNDVVQTILPDKCGFWSSPAYWNGHIYLAGGGSTLFLFDLKTGHYVVPPASRASELYDYPGATPSISANGNSDAIVWTIENLAGNPKDNPPAVLHAYDATNVGRELYNSNQVITRDQAGDAIKFTVPTIANGRVYIGTQTEVDVYGLLN